MPKDSVDAGSAVEPSSKRFDKQQQLRERLIAAGIALFAKKGFDGTTVSEIAKAAGSSRRTFFRYFKTKDDVVFDWLDEQGEIIWKKPCCSWRAFWMQIRRAHVF